MPRRLTPPLAEPNPAVRLCRLDLPHLLQDGRAQRVAVRPLRRQRHPHGAAGYAPASGNTTLAEQFYCAASDCAQSNTTASTASVDYTCQDLRCTCIPGTSFCGAPGAQIDLTTTIDGLSGPLSITCDVATGVECTFKQSVLQTLFGSGGLALSGCQWGECVLPGTIDRLASSLTGASSSSSGGGGGDSLSGGVIAGLAVLGALVVGLLALLALGRAKQRRARRRARAKADALLAGASSSSSSAEGKGLPVSPSAVGVVVSQLSYYVPAHRSFLTRRKTASAAGADDDRQILSSVTATIAGGSFCSILGPSGSGKTSLVDLVAGVRKSGYRTGTIELVAAAASASATAEQGVLGGGRELERVRVGYVDQNDVLCETSTVREAVMFAAELKLGEVPHEKKRCVLWRALRMIRMGPTDSLACVAPVGSVCSRFSRSWVSSTSPTA